MLGAYLFITVMTGNFETISEQALILIGIATGTGLGSVAIDKNKTSKAKEDLESATLKLAAVDGEKAETNTEYTRLQAIASPTPEEAARLIALAARKSELVTKRKALEERIDVQERKLSGPQTKGFWNDLVTDKNGISFHRFQIVVWTVVLGFVFVTEVHQRLAMPEFSATLLTLMGITSGTYLGFKFPEQKP